MPGPSLAGGRGYGGLLEIFIAKFSKGRVLSGFAFKFPKEIIALAKSGGGMVVNLPPAKKI